MVLSLASQHARPRSAGEAGRAEAGRRGEGVGSQRQAARRSSGLRGAGVLRGAGGGGSLRFRAKGEAARLNLVGAVRLPGLGAGLRLGTGYGWGRGYITFVGDFSNLLSFDMYYVKIV